MFKELSAGRLEGLPASMSLCGRMPRQKLYGGLTVHCQDYVRTTSPGFTLSWTTGAGTMGKLGCGPNWGNPSATRIMAVSSAANAVVSSPWIGSAMVASPIATAHVAQSCLAPPSVAMMMGACVSRACFTPS